MKRIIHDALILFLITAVAGVLLAVVNEATRAPIAAQKEAKVAAACRAVFAEAGEDGSFTELKDVQTKEEYAAFIQQYPKNAIDTVYEAHNGAGELLGYVINVSNKEGYGGTIRLSVGVRLDGTVNGATVLETSETPGLGLEAESVLTPQFAGRKAEAFRYVKTGAVNEDEVDAISSATITTNAVVNGVNAALGWFYSAYAG